MHSMFSGRKMRLIVTFLVVILFALTGVLSACGDKTDDTPRPSPTSTPSASPTASPKPALIKNGNFEDAYDTAYPKTPKNWSIYGDSFENKTASLTNVKRGIISVIDDFFDENKSKYGNIDNPGKPEDASPDDDNIIMIYNEKATAAKFKSQSISLPAGSYGKITLYAKTLNDIKPIDPENEENYDYYGATISISGMEEPIIIAGIDTNEQWVKYEFYVEGSPTTSKTMYVELGLGTGSPADSRGYTKGHAFFDAVSMDFINKAQFESTLSQYESDGELDDRFFFFNGSKDHENNYLVNRINSKDADKSDWTSFAYSYINRDTIDTYSFDELQLEPIVINENDYYDTIDYENFDTDSDFINVGVDEDFKEELENFPFSVSDVFYMENNNAATQGFRTKDFVMEPYSPAFGNTGIQQAYSYYRITVYLKTSDFVNNGFNLLLVSQDDSGTDYYSRFDNINTAKNNLTDEDFQQDANRHNKWANWTEYSFYVQASPYEEVTWHLELWLGPDDVRAKQINKFTRGTFCLRNAVQSLPLRYPLHPQRTPSDRIKSLREVPQIQTRLHTTNDNTGSIVNSCQSPVGRQVRRIRPAQGKPGKSVKNHHNGSSSGIINEDFLAAYNTNGYIDGDLSNVSNFGSPNYLMIRNVAETSYGYTSAVKTLSSKSYYKFTISVKTFENASASIYIVDDKYNVLSIEDTDNAEFTNFMTNGWETYTFYIKTGDLSKTIRIELWNGSRDGSDTGTSEGYVLFDDIVMGISTEEIYNDAEAGANLIKLDFEESMSSPARASHDIRATRNPKSR